MCLIVDANLAALVFDAPPHDDFRPVINKTEQIRSLCESDDPHVIALAQISGARILCSRDKNLHKDFTNSELVNDPRGRIYQNSSHAQLFRRHGHTEACRKSMGQK